MPPTVSVASTSFRFFRAEEVRKMSAVEITSTTTFDTLNQPVPGGLYDPKLGPLERGVKCATCGQTDRDCPGHLAHIELPVVCYHPLLLPQLHRVLQAQCFNCHRLRLEDASRQAARCNLIKAGEFERAAAVSEDDEIEFLPAAGAHARREHKGALAEIWKVLKGAKRCGHCGAAARTIRKEGSKFFQVPLSARQAAREADLGIKLKSARGADADDSDDEAAAASEFLDAREVYLQTKLLWENAGAIVDAALGRPRGDHEVFFLHVVVVPPPRFRPAQYVNGEKVEHPQNVMLAKIVSTAAKVRETKDKKKLVDSWIALQRDIDTFVASVRKLLEKKEGLFRKNMMGKRVNFCCRSVISPDNFLRSGEIGVPLNFATGLSYPERVTPHNVELLRKLVENGPSEWPGANFVDLGRSKIDLKHIKREKRIALAKQLMTTPGQTVGRHLLDDDYLLVNRQPTLHKPGIMAHRAVVLKAHNTLRMHYANCNAYNADFDGDEINCHFVQNELARAEAKYIMATEHQYMVATNGKPLRGLIQDHIDAAVKLSCEDCFLDKEFFCQFAYEACRSIVGNRGTINVSGVRPAILKPERLYTGKQLLSLVVAHVGHLRRFEAKAKVSHKAISMGGLEDEHVVLFRDGRFLKGIIDKASIGASAHGLIHAIYEIHGPHAAASLLDAFARLLTLYLRDVAIHTCGLSDLTLTPQAERERRRLIDEAEAKGLQAFDEFVVATTKKSYDNRNEAMAAIYRAGRGAELDGHMRAALAPLHSEIVKACLPGGLEVQFPNNSFSLMVTTGAKGSTVNQSQVSCALGQQTLEGRRVPLTAFGRSLPCFDRWDPSPRAGGFISDRFLTGLRPPEYFFHCMAGREGLIDTAVKTSRSGYLQRCLVKHLEDLVVAYDHTVRDSEGNVIQFLYGDDGLDCTKSAIIDANKFQFLEDNLEATSVVVPKKVREARTTTLTKGARVLVLRGKHRSVATVRKVRKKQHGTTTTIDVRFDDGAKRRRIGEYELVEEPVASRFPPWTPGAVSDRVYAAIEDDQHDLVYERYVKALAAPGEAVGAIAAQSVGEPSTQMTLNTFHLAGHGAGNVTLGVPRLRELLMTGGTKTPTITLACADPRGFASRLNRVVLSELVDTEQGFAGTERVALRDGYLYRDYLVDFRLHPMDKIRARFGAAELPLDEVLVARLADAVKRTLVRKFTREAAPPPISASSSSSSSAKTRSKKDDEVDEEEKDDGGASSAGDDDDEPEDPELAGAEAMQAGTDYDDDDDDDDDVQQQQQQQQQLEDDILMMDVDRPSTAKKASSNWKKRLTVTAAHAMRDRMHIQLDVKVPASRPRVAILEIIEQSCGNCVVVPGVAEATPVEDRVVVRGNDIHALWSAATTTTSDSADLDNLHCNDVRAVMATYGVEAARATLIREIQSVFGVYGIVVGPRHLSLVGDKVMFHGEHHAMNRIYMGLHSSPWLKMSFETTGVFLTEAALTQATDDITSPSASIVMGQAPKVGTNIFDILVDIQPTTTAR